MKIEPNPFFVTANEVKDNKSKEIYPEGKRTYDVASDHFKNRVKQESSLRNGMRAVFIWF